MNGMLYADIPAIQKVCTDIFQVMLANALESSFKDLLSRTNQCIKAENDFFDYDKTVLPESLFVLILKSPCLLKDRFCTAKILFCEPVGLQNLEKTV